jgi:hypothetical protein
LSYLVATQYNQSRQQVVPQQSAPANSLPVPVEPAESKN